MRGPKARYDELVAVGRITKDPAQAAAMDRLDSLSRALVKHERATGGVFGRFRRAEPPRGLYLWGGVGRGKSMLMDVFHNHTPMAAKRRVHFHEFMAEIHEALRHWRGAELTTRRAHHGFDRRNPDDPIPHVAADVADQARLLCFDEFQVTDIADAMILGRLFEQMFARGAVIVATSNRAPDDLYTDGINRQLFLPTIALIKDRLDVMELKSARDYRLDKLSGAPVYLTPLGPETDAALDAIWEGLIAGADVSKEELKVKGRRLIAPRAARGAVRFEFAALCERPLGASDYLAIVRRYQTLFVDRIPIIIARDVAKRLVTLIDAVYESRTKFVCSAAAAPGDLYPAGDGSFEFERTVSRLLEMQSADYLAAAHAQVDLVDDADDPAAAPVVEGRS